MTKIISNTVLMTSLAVVLTISATSQAFALDVSFTPISTPFNNPIGIDHFEGTPDKVVISVNYAGGIPRNFELVAADGSRTGFSSLSGFTDEVKIATARDDGVSTSDGLSLGGFVAGTMFTGNGIDGQIAKVNPDGTFVNPWVNLPGTGNGLMRGSLYVDRTGEFGGDLVVATTAGEVWRINSAGIPTKLADVNVHLEGVMTVPRDPQFGGLAGKIIAGAEGQGRVYAVDTSGSVQFWTIPFNIEDIDLIPENENFFGVNFGTSRLLGVPASSFDSVEGEILLTQEFGGGPTGLGLLRWDSVTNAPTVEFIGRQAGSFAQGQWEHVTFSSAGIVEIPPAEEICGDGIDNDNDGQIDEGCNTAPVANDDAYPVAEDSVNNILNILTNDSDAENDPLTIDSIDTAGTIGTVVNNGGDVSYTPPANFNGVTTFTYIASDGNGGLSNSATVTITVTPVNDVPTCDTPTTTTPYIWPPNHKMVSIGAAMSATDIDGDTITTTVSSIFQDEPTNGLGDGDTSPDATLSPAKVRAERSGTGDGRVYVVTLTADDSNGGTCSGSVKIFVPHDMKKPVTAVNSGATYDSTTP